MNENAKKWVAALKSGEYKQTQQQLAAGTGADRAYCCLGVACRLYRAEHTDFSWRGDHEGLPKRVQQWLGLQDEYGYYGGASLAEKNDQGASFEEIAAIIEEQPHGLFK